MLYLCSFIKSTINHCSSEHCMCYIVHTIYHLSNQYLCWNVCTQSKHCLSEQYWCYNVYTKGHCSGEWIIPPINIQTGTSNVRNIGAACLHDRARWEVIFVLQSTHSRALVRWVVLVLHCNDDSATVRPFVHNIPSTDDFSRK